MRAAVIGAGPIGLEAAVALDAAGHEVTVLEQGAVGEAVSSWGHVQLFTPWRMNVSARGRDRLGGGWDEATCPTGAAFVERYLVPLAATLDVRERHRVLGVSRRHLRKGDALGRRRRADDPFQILVEAPAGQTVMRADLVVDCTGVLGDPAPMGPGGLPCPGEGLLATAGRVRYGPAVVTDLAGEHVILVGDGASAVTVLADLLAIGAVIHWVTPAARVPGFVSPDDDPLPQRRTLYAVGAAAPSDPRVCHHPVDWVVRVRPRGDGLVATLASGATLDAHAAVVCTGFRPDHRITRELQVHVCWGTEGPMKLAAALLAAAGGGGDCLDAPALGPTVLASPEPHLFVLGAKSYGRRSDFLLQSGHAQVDDLLTLLA